MADTVGRGIKVCEEWEDYTNFRDWALGHGFSDSLTLDRIDNNGDYSPDNCRWATYKEQSNNRRSNHPVEIDGVKMNCKQWAEFLGIPSYVIRTRLHRGLSEAEAITRPVRTNVGGKYVIVDYYKEASERLEREKAQLNMFDMM